ncbi:hypothetical protein [Streptomyces sp. NPDC059783]|uniref:hypothetical protein n=1 Tax=Streptomyces sp. NPDC059783 TaxID=3346944 RepID=UPI0036698CC4
MPQADEWSAFVLHSAGGRLVSLMRHTTVSKAGLPPPAAQRFEKGDGPFAPLLDALEAVNGKHCELHDRLTRLERMATETPAPQLSQQPVALTALVDAWEFVKNELSVITARLAQPEGAVFGIQPLPQPSRKMNPPSVAATVRAARARRAPRAVSRA